jgi:hypothetical protein
MLNAYFKSIGKLALRIVKHGSERQYILYDTMISKFLVDSVRGFVSTSKVTNDDNKTFWMVDDGGAEYDFGPSIYMIAIQDSGAVGLAPSYWPSDAAQRVWKRFYDDNVDGNGPLNLIKIRDSDRDYLSYAYAAKQQVISISQALVNDVKTISNKDLVDVGFGFFDERYVPRFKASMSYLSYNRLEAKMANPQGLGLYTGPDDDYSQTFILYDAQDVLNRADDEFETDNGFISYFQDTIGAVLNIERKPKFYTVEESAAKKKLGPSLYIIVMQDATAKGKGLASDMDGETDEDALNVWQHFLKDSQKLNPVIQAHDRGEDIGSECVNYYYTTNQNIINTAPMYSLSNQALEKIGIILKKVNYGAGVKTFMSDMATEFFEYKYAGG